MANEVLVLERVVGERPGEEILIIADLAHSEARDEQGHDPSDDGNACIIQRTIFKRIGPDFGSGSETQTGLLAVESKCSDPQHEAEWHEWYNTVHVPDMLASGLYYAAYRFEIAARTEGRGHYLALYETNRDPAKAHRAFWEEFRPRWIASGRVIDTMRVTSAISYGLNCFG